MRFSYSLLAKAAIPLSGADIALGEISTSGVVKIAFKVRDYLSQLLIASGFIQVFRGGFAVSGCQCEGGTGYSAARQAESSYPASQVACPLYLRLFCTQSLYRIEQHSLGTVPMVGTGGAECLQCILDRRLMLHGFMV